MIASCFGLGRRLSVSIALFTAAMIPSGAAWAHHSYAMFDGTKTVSVSGTVAKVEWANPHVYVWIYVRNTSAPSGYDLYAFENGSTGVLSRLGWSKSTFTIGEQVTVEYWPLKDGRTGGHFVKATHVDGRVEAGAGGPGPATVVPRESPVRK
ncbi:MAG TPA: DUF6152 family protein [Steroidobacteraceae bacterium]|jgi:hypothetical protein